MECPNCHTVSSSDAKVCRQCGFSLVQAQSSAAKPQSTTAQGPIAGFKSFNSASGETPPGGHSNAPRPVPPPQYNQPGLDNYQSSAPQNYSHSVSYPGPGQSHQRPVPPQGNQSYGQQPSQGYQQQPGCYSQSNPGYAQQNYPPYQQNPQYQSSYRGPDPNPPIGGYIKCPNCGALSSLSNPNCAHCGMPLSGMGYLSSKDKTTALLLCIFLGAIGGHMFYVGKTGMGILYLFTAGLLGIGVIIDLINIINGTFTDSDGLRLRQN